MADTTYTKLIPLSQGQFAIVDEKWFEMLSQIPWVVTINKTMKPYAAAATLKRQNNGKRGMEQMHRLILDAPKGSLVDHINLNTLDNRESNLRLCGFDGNSQNRAKFKNKSSKFKGVGYQKKSNKWRATIGINGRNVYLGEYTTELKAAKIRDEAVRKYHGEFGIINLSS